MPKEKTSKINFIPRIFARFNPPSDCDPKSAGFIKNILNKKIPLLILALIFIQILIPITVFAQTSPTDFLLVPKLLFGGAAQKLILSTLADILAGLGYAALWITSWLIYIASGIFDIAAKFTLDYNTYSGEAATAVYLGWQGVRDFVNLFFIFAILIIAVSLILRISQYYSKQVLIRFVVAALFINFSFFICQQIINFANSGALYFKNAAIINVGGQDSSSWKLSSLFVEKLNPQQFLGGYKAGETKILDNMSPAERAEVDRINNSLAKLEEKDVSLVAIIISTIGGSIFMLVASLILFAAALMFIIRAVILWNLIILSPIAFISSIFPASQSWFHSWWNRFLREAFVAPVFLFLFYIDMMILNSDFLTEFVAQNNSATIGQSVFFNYYLVMNYIVMITLFAKSLMVAKSLGATGADTFMKWGEKIRDRGYDIARGPGRQLRTKGAEIGTSMLEGEGRVARVARWIPGLKAGAREAVKYEKGRVDELQKTWSAYSSKDLANEVNKSFITPSKLSAITKELQKREDLEMIKPFRLKQAHERISNIGESTKEIETFMPSLAKSGQSREKAVQRQRADKASDYVKNTEEFANPETMEYARKYWGGDHLANMFQTAKTNDNAMSTAGLFIKEYVNKYGADMGGGKIDADKIVKGLENDNNFKAAKFIDSKEGAKTLEEFLKDSRNTTGFTSATQPKGAIKERSKEASELRNAELVREMKAASASGAKTEDKEKITEVVKNIDANRLNQLMEDMAANERKELAIMMKEDKDEAKKIINIDPTIVDNLTSQEKIDFGVAGLNLTTTKDYINQMPSRMTRFLHHDAITDTGVIQNLSRFQLEDIARNSNFTNEEIKQITDVLNTSASGMTQELKTYLNGSPFWKLNLP